MTATLTEPQRTAREDGISGYVVALKDGKETSAREAVEIVTHVNGETLQVGIDRIVTILAKAASNRVAVFSERDTEMINICLRLEAGDSVILYPVNHPDTPSEARRVHRK